MNTVANQPESSWSWYYAVACNLIFVVTILVAELFPYPFNLLAPILKEKTDLLCLHSSDNGIEVFLAIF